MGQTFPISQNVLPHKDKIRKKPCLPGRLVTAGCPGLGPASLPGPLPQRLPQTECHRRPHPPPPPAQCGEGLSWCSPQLCGERALLGGGGPVQCVGRGERPRGEAVGRERAAPGSRDALSLGRAVSGCSLRCSSGPHAASGCF